MVPDPWGRGVEESYDFDVTKLDKLFDFLLEKMKVDDNPFLVDDNPFLVAKSLGNLQQHIQRAI